MLVVGEGKQQILVFPLFHQMLQQGIDGHLIRPVIDTQEYHRAGITEAEIVILHGFLENFLQRTCTAR